MAFIPDSSSQLDTPGGEVIAAYHLEHIKRAQNLLSGQWAAVPLYHPGQARQPLTWGNEWQSLEQAQCLLRR